MTQRYIPLKNRAELERVGLPWSINYVYKIRHLGMYPTLFPKIGGRVVLDVAALEKLVAESREKQQRRHDRLRRWL